MAKDPVTRRDRDGAPGPEQGPGNLEPIEEALLCGRPWDGCRWQMGVDAFEVDRNGDHDVLLDDLDFAWGPRIRLSR
ncbi:hypothetical protein ACFPC0_19745 [Streptomyces andamanensis]|uniref:Uncharacterized protein n=1 Tax=Streptomyces andamanensis TaxID=1565035 RepID=A0ABV8TH81_9ACTN